MTFKIYFIFQIILFTMTTIGQELNIDVGIKTAEVFSQAIINKDYSIALCKGLPIKRSPDKYLLKDGTHILNSNYSTKEARVARIVVVNPIKGDFDLLVVYSETLKRGKIWPAFNSPSFFPDEMSRWIIVFEEKVDGETIDIKNSDKKVPILELASRGYGIIRYDEPNHLGINAEKFLSDLKSIVEHIEGQEKLSADQLKTDLGKMILDRVSSP